MADDEDRDAILMRRRRFVALALAGVTAPAAVACEEPQPCLDVTSTPCLAAPPPRREEEDANAGEATADPDSGPGTHDPAEPGGGGGELHPQVCLEFAPPGPDDVDDEGNPRGT